MKPDVPTAFKRIESLRKEITELEDTIKNTYKQGDVIWLRGKITDFSDAPEDHFMEVTFSEASWSSEERVEWFSLNTVIVKETTGEKS